MLYSPRASLRRWGRRGKQRVGDAEVQRSVAVIEREVSSSAPVPRPARATYPRWFGPLSLLAFMVLDALTVALAFRLAYWVRYDAQIGGTVEWYNQQPLSVY